MQLDVIDRLAAEKAENAGTNCHYGSMSSNRDTKITSSEIINTILLLILKGLRYGSTLYYPEWLIRRILRDTNIIAMVGASSNWNRPSYFAMKYLQSKGYRIIPVNPTISGTKLLGENVYANLKDIPEKIEMVDIFQKSERVPKIVDDAITIGAKIVWMQLTVRHRL